MINQIYASEGVDTLARMLRQITDPIEYATLAVTVAVLLLGIYVGYQAYRGYKRNGNRAVLLLGLGIFLVTTVRELGSLAAYLLVGESPLVLFIVSFGLSILGLASVLYGFIWA